MLRLAVVSSHPIQYNAPAFRGIAQYGDVVLKVFYEWEGPTKLDPEFGRPVEWDIPLLDGYDHTFVRNVSSSPGSHHFNGINNPEIVRELVEWRPDVILLYGWAFKSHMQILRRLHGQIPIMFRGDSTLLDDLPLLRRIARRTLLRYVFSKIDMALYAGRRNREYFEWAGVDADRLMWAPHAVDNQRFTPDAENAAAASRWRKELNIGEDEVVYLFAGKLYARKNPHLLLGAFNRVYGSIRGRAHLVFAGSGALETEIRAEANGRANTHFLGFQNQSAMPSVYHLSDVLVLPSLGETWGLSVNEAMASGRSAIVSDRVGCASDLVHDGVTGFTFSCGSLEGLTRCMIELSDRTKAEAMGNAARELIADWSIDAYSKAVVEAARMMAR